MARLALLLIVLGFGSLVLNLFNMEFRVLAWADDYQPWAGIGIGVLGVLIIVIQALLGRGKKAETATKEAA
jgi:Na+-driven multidrug efflux pump